MDVPGYRENGPQRCYFCKSVLLDTANALADKLGYATITTGTNASDVVAGFRPGIRPRPSAARVRRSPTPVSTRRRCAPSPATGDSPSGTNRRRLHGEPGRVRHFGHARSAGPIERAETAVRSALGGAVRDLRVRDLGDAVRLEIDSDLVERARETVR